MKAPVSVLSICYTGLREVMFWRTRLVRPFASLSQCQHSTVEGNTSISVSTCNENDNLLLNFDSISAECIEEFDGNEDKELERIKLILKSHGWNLSSRSRYFQIDLHQYNIVQILNDLFEKGLNASVALYFFRWSEWVRGSEHAVQSICTMIHILVAGNMNHRAVDLILCLVRKNGGEEWWLDFLLKVLYETRNERWVLGIAYSMLVDCYVKEKMVNAGLKLAFQMMNFNFFPSLGVCNSLVRALLQSDQIELAWEFLEQIQSRGLGLDVSIISLFIHKYCSKGDLESGWKLLIGMETYGIRADVVAYTIVIDSLRKMSFLREATSLLFKMIQIGVSVDSVSVSSIIDGFCKLGKFEKASYLMNIFCFVPNIYIFNSFISKLCAEGDMVLASCVFFEMLLLGLHPDCFTYTTIIGGYFNIEDVNGSLNFLGKMLKAGIKPSVTTLTLFIDHYSKSGNVEMAELILQNMLTVGLVPDLVAYNTLIYGFGKKGFFEKVFRLLDMMKSNCVSPDNVTYNTIIHCLVIKGFVNEARELLSELIRRGFSPDVVTFTDIVSGFSKRGNFEEAFHVWFCMSDHHIKPDVITCSAFLSGYCRARQMHEANVLFKNMLAVGLVPDLMLYNTLIHGFCSVGNIDDACHLVNMMVRQGISPDNFTCRALSLGYEKRGCRNPGEAASFKLQRIIADVWSEN